MDITAISTLLGSIKTATEIAKVIKETDLSLATAETKLKLADLISALADARIEVTEIQQSLAERESEIKALKAALDVKERLKWQDPCYWLEEAEGKQGPFCQCCYDSNRKLIRLQGDGEGYWECKTCKNTYVDPQRRERDDAMVRGYNNSLRHDPYA